MTIIDTSRSTASCLDCLKAAGVSTVFRYYARETRLPGKRLTRAEAEALISAGIGVGVVFQNAGDSAACFSTALGEADGTYARDYAAGAIGQPVGSAIFFAVDYDANDDDLAAFIFPYFEAARRAVAPGYRVGVYGTGRVCGALRGAGLADLAWLSNRPGDIPFDGWTLRQEAPTTLCGLPVDRNRPNDGVTDWGTFGVLDIPAAPEG
ncbi:MAG: DUF1906 domain-containing protein [Bauldia sp.]|nr:DUF1906 domain-containing protein [Bauldia sp.]